MTATTVDQRTLWPGYAPPNWWAGFPNSAWNNWADYAPAGQDRAGSIAIMNPASGPGTAVNSDWTAVVNHARNCGHRVLGYVDTNYAARPAADVEADIDKYYSWYPVDGIMFDRMSNNVADATYYRARYAYAHTKAATVLVVGNPGAAASTDWQVKTPKSADLLIVFEDTAANYLTWTPPGWITGSTYPTATFAHLVHACAAVDLPTMIARSKTLRAAYRYITDDVMPNPWDTLGLWPAQATP
jgi:spherulation-specific family 4 protein